MLLFAGSKRASFLSLSFLFVNIYIYSVCLRYFCLTFVCYDMQSNEDAAAQKRELDQVVADNVLLMQSLALAQACGLLASREMCAAGGWVWPVELVTFYRSR